MLLSKTEIKRIAVLRALQLGDLLCSIPAIRALRCAYPNAEITLLGLPWAALLTDRFPNYLDEFKHFPGYPGLPEQKFDPEMFLWFLSDVQHQHYDLVLQMQGNGSIVNPMIELFGAKYSAGFYLQDDYRPNHDLFLLYPNTVHEIERHLQLMAHLEILQHGSELEFPLTGKDQQEFNELALPIEQEKYICIHAGSRGTWRQWPEEYFAQIADHCVEKGFEVVLTGTKDELEIVNTVKNEMNYEPVITAGKTTLGAAGILIKNAFALISNCTGVSHMAAALKTPSVVISMDGEPNRWAPTNKKLHKTVDWLRTPEYGLVLREVETVVRENHHKEKN